MSLELLGVALLLQMVVSEEWAEVDAVAVGTAGSHRSNIVVCHSSSSLVCTGVETACFLG